MSEHAKTHFLDVDTFEVARSIHRIVRAMHDGECPKCHHLFIPMNMRSGVNDFIRLDCPKCPFSISGEEAQAAMAHFAPVMEKNLEVFEQWRATRK